MPLALQLLFNILGLIPLNAEAEAGIAVANDLVQIGMVVDAWFKSPKGQAFLAHVEALIKAHGGTVTKDADGKIIAATLPAQTGGRPSGANRGGLMAPGT